MYMRKQSIYMVKYDPLFQELASKSLVCIMLGEVGFVAFICYFNT
jgi:hypothetical protein